MLKISEIGVFLNCIQGLLHLELHLGFSILKIINVYVKCLITHLTSHHCVGVVTNIVYKYLVVTILTMHFLGYTYPQHSQPQKSHNVELKFNRSLLITCIDGELPDLLDLFLITYIQSRRPPDITQRAGCTLVCFCYCFPFFLPCHTRSPACGILIPYQELIPQAVLWKCRILTIEPPGNSLMCFRWAIPFGCYWNPFKQSLCWYCEF